MFLVLVLFGFMQGTAGPSATDDTLPPQGSKVVAITEGRGAQIYHCSEKNSVFAWIFDAPQATLYQPGADMKLGTHTTGPTWTWNDGSSVKGTLSAQKAASSSMDLPWLLLKTQPVSTEAGTLAKVAWVRRSNTKGGIAPTAGCDSQHAGTVQQVPYSATYTFYSATSAQQAH